MAKKPVTPIKNHIAEGIPVVLAIGAGATGLLFAGAMLAPAEEEIDKTYKVTVGVLTGLLAVGAITVSQIQASQKTDLQKELVEATCPRSLEA